jgi:YD repeat-containing protein
MAVGRYLSRRGWLQGFLAGLAVWLFPRKARGSQALSSRPTHCPACGWPDGRVTACTGDALAKVTTYTYDVRNRLTSMAGPLGTVTTMVYYDDNGHRA